MQIMLSYSFYIFQADQTCSGKEF